MRWDNADEVDDHILQEQQNNNKYKNNREHEDVGNHWKDDRKMNWRKFIGNSFNTKVH